MKDMSVSFGGVRAVDGVTLNVTRGQLVGLIGANGAGKTTFIDAMTGFVPSTGRVWFGRTGDLPIPRTISASGPVWPGPGNRRSCSTT